MMRTDPASRGSAQSIPSIRFIAPSLAENLLLRDDPFTRFALRRVYLLIDPNAQPRFVGRFLHSRAERVAAWDNNVARRPIILGPRHCFHCLRKVQSHQMADL